MCGSESMMWTDLETKRMVENARRHREQRRDRSCRYRKNKELSKPSATMVLGVRKHFTIDEVARGLKALDKLGIRI